MSVVIPVLNYYSSRALCAGGTLLGNPLLAQVGALIGFAGAILAWIMYSAMGKTFVITLSNGFIKHVIIFIRTRHSICDVW